MAWLTGRYGQHENKEWSPYYLHTSTLAGIALRVHACTCIIIARVYDREESIERRHTVHQMYAESNWLPLYLSQAWNLHTDQSKRGWCNLSTHPSVGDVIYFLDRLHHPRLDWSVCMRNSKLVTDTGEVTLLSAYTVRYSLLYHILLIIGTTLHVVAGDRESVAWREKQDCKGEFLPNDLKMSIMGCCHYSNIKKPVVI